MTICENRVIDYLTANFTENETAWDSTATYNYADEVRYGHYIYKYAGADGTNTVDDPYVDSLKIDKKWVQIKPTNYYAMLDGKTSTQTKNANTIEITLQNLNYDVLALMELDAISVSVTLTDDLTSSVVYTKTVDLIDNSEVVDFMSYCFNEFRIKTSVYERPPFYSNATLRIIIDKTGSVAKCGRLVFGRSYYVGITGLGANLSLESYSKRETDVFGNVNLLHRDSVNYDSYEVTVLTTKIPTLRRKMKELDAIPTLFIMDENENSKVENLLNFGYWESFNILLKSAEVSTASFTIKGIL